MNTLLLSYAIASTIALIVLIVINKKKDTRDNAILDRSKRVRLLSSHDQNAYFVPIVDIVDIGVAHEVDSPDKKIYLIRTKSAKAKTPMYKDIPESTAFDEIGRFGNDYFDYYTEDKKTFEIIEKNWIIHTVLKKCKLIAFIKRI